MILVTLPLRTVSELNGREHWAKKAKRVKDHRRTVGMVIIAHALKRDMLEHMRLPVAARVTASLTRIAPRELDDDNLRGALKAVRDGVADALGVNDRDPRVSWAYAQRRGKPKEYGVEIRISPRSAQQEEQPEGHVAVKRKGARA